MPTNVHQSNLTLVFINNVFSIISYLCLISNSFLGAQIWIFRTRCQIQGNLIHGQHETLITGDTCGNIYALHANDGILLWVETYVKFGSAR